MLARYGADILPMFMSHVQIEMFVLRKHIFVKHKLNDLNGSLPFEQQQQQQPPPKV